MASAEKLTAEVRQFLSLRLIKRGVQGLGMGDVFRQSQSWEGYDTACDSWHDAYWKWVDANTPAQAVQQWKDFKFDWSRNSPAAVVARSRAEGFALPVVTGEEKHWIEELFRQEAFQQISVFQLAMRGPEAIDPITIGSFASDIFIASHVGDTSYSKQLALQRQRKPTKDKGDRRLKPQLLVYWISGCLWAFTTEGVAQFLNDYYPRSGNKPYDSKTISDTRRRLKLYRSPRPLFWGVAGTPPSLELLR